MKDFFLVLQSPVGKEEWQVRFNQIEGGDWGECDYHNRTITISNDIQDKLDIVCTALHEVLHAGFPYLKEGAISKCGEFNIRQMLLSLRSQLEIL